jgi:methylation protein EvaC
VAQALEKEKSMRLAEPATWEAFAQRVNHIRTELPALLRKLKAQGKRIIGYGASAKGNTLLNTCGITTKELDYIIDNTPFKQNKIAPGSWIPVRPPEMLLKDQPDYARCWNWRGICRAGDHQAKLTPLESIQNGCRARRTIYGSSSRDLMCWLRI